MPHRSRPRFARPHIGRRGPCGPWHGTPLAASASRARSPSRDGGIAIRKRQQIDGASQAAYERLGRRLVLARLRLATAVGLPALALGAALNVLFAPDRLSNRLAGFAFLGAAYLAMIPLTRWPRTARHARTLAVTSMLTLAAGLVYLLAQSPDDLDVLTGPVTCVMIGSTLLFPWGAAAQAVVSGALGLGFAALLWSHAALIGMRATNINISLGASAALSVIGALVLERSRRTAFGERHRTRAIAAQRRRLIDVGRDLRSTLRIDTIASRLTEHAARLMPADGVVLSLRDASRGSYRVTAVIGEPRLRDLVGAEWEEDFAVRFLAGFAPAEVREFPGTPLDELVTAPLAWLGVRRALAAAIGSGTEVLGFLAWTRAADTQFTRLQRLAAQGIADQGYTALGAARLYEDATRASRLKSEFVSTMSHELRTPLNVIMGYNQILSDSLPPAPETTQALDGVRRASVELLELVEATLDLGRLEAGREMVCEERVRVRDLFDELAREFAPVPRPAAVALAWEAGANPTISVDRRKLKTILKNLVGNALKFTPAGSVRVECHVPDAQAEFRVIDTGIGIHPEEQAAVFDMFRQVDNSDTRRYGGTGLGLYIVRRLVRVLGGEVRLDSRPGQGSTFTVLVPLSGVGDPRRRLGSSSDASVSRSVDQPSAVPQPSEPARHNGGSREPAEPIRRRRRAAARAASGTPAAPAPPAAARRRP